MADDKKSTKSHFRGAVHSAANGLRPWMNAGDAIRTTSTRCWRQRTARRAADGGSCAIFRSGCDQFHGTEQPEPDGDSGLPVTISMEVGKYRYHHPQSAAAEPGSVVELGIRLAGEPLECEGSHGTLNCPRRSGSSKRESGFA